MQQVDVISEDGDPPLDRRLSCSCPFAPFGDGLPRLSFSYHKLPPPQLKLSVVKLDGGEFDVCVGGNATVRELKRAVEDVFALAPPEEGGGDISWSHVWWHFCLCHEDQKLIDNKDYLKSFGIKDGDKLHFTRHLSINYHASKRVSKGDKVAAKEQFILCAGSVRSDVSINEESGDSYHYRDLHEEASSDDLQEEASSDDLLHEEASSNDTHEEASNGDLHEEDCPSDYFDADNKYYKKDSERDENQVVVHPRSKLSRFFKGWLSYSNLWSMGRSKSLRKVRPSRLSGKFLKLGSKMSLTRL